MSHFVRIPPDSSGKRIKHIRKIDANITISDTDLFSSLQIGDIIISGSKTAEYTGYVSNTSNEVSIYLSITNGSDVFVTGDVLSHNGNVFATTNGVNDLYIPSSIISDSDNPDNNLRIDNHGSAFIRFKDGDALLDSFGNLQTSNSSVLKSYLFLYSDLPREFGDIASNGGSVVHNPNSSYISLITTSNAASSIKRTSNLWIPYTPLKSNFISMSIGLGDSGKENVVRRWGLFDDDDGVYFELNGSVLSVNIKNSIDSSINSVIQSDFNGSQLDNIVIDDFLLNFSKFNLYWIDFQWQGVGIVRFGVFSPSGDRVTLHVFNNPNSNNTPYMKRGTLPFRMEQFNTGIPSSGSEMKCACVGIVRNSENIYLVGDINTAESNHMHIIGNDDFELMTVRPKLLVDGDTNRVTLVPLEFQYYISGGPVKITYTINSVLGTSSFTSVSEFSEISIITEDTISFSSANILDFSIYGDGTHRVELNDSKRQLDRTLQLSVDGNFQNTFSVSAKHLIPGATASVYAIAKWREVI